MDLGQWWSTSEWWTYRPRNFLMFSPRIYGRLFESIDAAYGPAACVLVAIALPWLAMRARRVRRPQGAVNATFFARGPLALLAGCWLFVAWAFFVERYAPINWPARYFAGAFVLEASLLGALAASIGLRASTGVGPRTLAGQGLVLWAMAGHPMLAVMSGRTWRQAEFFGLAPDPTVIATLGVLLLVEAPEGSSARRLLRVSRVVPIAWCAVSAATLATLGAREAWALLAVPCVTLLCSRTRSRPG